MNSVLTKQELDSYIIPLLRKYKAQKAILFGSYARGTAGPESDIDLVIVGGPTFKATNVFAIAEELHLATANPVDVYELREINPKTPFYNSIFSEGRTVLWSNRMNNA